MAVGEGTAESAERDAVAKAIAARIETLDEAFLVTLQGFVQAADAEGDAAVAGGPCGGRYTSAWCLSALRCGCRAAGHVGGTSAANLALSILNPALK